MTKLSFVKGVGIGVATGLAMGMMLAPRKKNHHGKAGKTIKTIGQMIENFSDSILS